MAEKANARKLTRGSAWRRWDLHIHTPATALNDQFGSWEEYLGAVSNQKEVRVLGITDYFTFTNYTRVKQYRSEGKLPEIDLLLANVEFRIAPPTDKATALNIHLLISSADPDHEQHLHNALARLTWKYLSNNYSCLPDQLIALGRAFDTTAKEDRIALARGVTQFKVDFSAFRLWYESEPWLKTNSIVVVAAGADGLSGFQKDGHWGGYREEITRFSQALFSGRPGEREFWLGERSKEEADAVARLGGPKPCLHGSDAHRLEDLFRPAQDRYCWIKADPTFDGLRQVLYEPGSRVHIGPSAPRYHDESRVISAVRFSSAGGWFGDAEIPLNEGLVSVIGQKGSGKSALAELVAFAAGGWVTDEAGSFIRRAGTHLEDMRVSLVWADGRVTDARIGDPQPGDRAVRYLSQKFVERLCADDQLGDELISEIEDVIFSYIDPSDTLNASSFAELRAMLTDGMRAEAEGHRSDVRRLTLEEVALRAKAATIPAKKARLRVLDEERKGLAKQMPKAATPEEEKTHKELQSNRAALAILQKETAEDKQKLQKIKDLEGAIASFATRMDRFYSEIEPILKEIGVAPAEREQFKPRFFGDTAVPVARCRQDLVERIKKRNGADDKPVAGTIRALEKEIDDLTKRESADKARAKRIEEIQKRLVAIDAEVERISREVAEIDGPDKDRIATIGTERMTAYAAFFRILKREQDALEQLYRPVSTRLQSEGSFAQERSLEFSIRWDVDLKRWLERGALLFDQRRVLPYDTIEGLGMAAQAILVPAWTSGDHGKVQPAMDEFLVAFRKKDLPPTRYLRSGVGIQDVFDWLYETDHVRLSYGLKYNGADLEKLSPGTKGIVLLILYLGMDIADTRPLIVDQPDENLDNESIYKLLTAYFRAAKVRRQIVLITHNPNLVVNGDSEQVIVANCDRRENGLPYITYEAGALEDPDVRAHVCRVLEGGADAFRKRERRYGFPVSSA